MAAVCVTNYSAWRIEVSASVRAITPNSPVPITEIPQVGGGSAGAIVAEPGGARCSPMKRARPAGAGPQGPRSRPHSAFSSRIRPSDRSGRLLRGPQIASQRLVGGGARQDRADRTLVRPFRPAPRWAEPRRSSLSAPLMASPRRVGVRRGRGGRASGSSRRRSGGRRFGGGGGRAWRRRSLGRRRSAPSWGCRGWWSRRSSP